MTKKDKKRKLRGILAMLEPEKKQEILAKNMEDDLKDFSNRISKLKDNSNEVFDLQLGLEILRNSLFQKISELPTKQSLEELKASVTDIVKYVESGLNSSVSSLKREVESVKTDSENKREISKLRSDIERRIIEAMANRGGGSIPLQVSAGGTVANTRYAEINFVGATATTNNTTKKTDITTSGGGMTITALTLVAGQYIYTGITVLPKYIFTDTGNLKENFGYTRTGSAGNYTITFDIPPQSWADIIS